MSSKISSFTSQLDKVIDQTFTNYRGRLIERLNSHEFRVGKAIHSSIEEAKKAVDNSYKILLSTIR